MWLVSFRPISAWIKWRAVKECVILRELAPAFMGLEAPVGSMGEGAIKVTLHCLVAFHFKCFRNFSIFSRTDQEWMWYGNPNILVGYWSCTFHHKTLLFATKQLNEVCLPFPFEEGGWLPSFLFALLGSLLQRQWWSGTRQLAWRFGFGGYWWHHTGRGTRGWGHDAALPLLTRYYLFGMFALYLFRLYAKTWKSLKASLS